MLKETSGLGVFGFLSQLSLLAFFSKSLIKTFAYPENRLTNTSMGSTAAGDAGRVPCPPVRAAPGVPVGAAGAGVSPTTPVPWRGPPR